MRALPDQLSVKRGRRIWTHSLPSHPSPSSDQTTTNEIRVNSFPHQHLCLEGFHVEVPRGVIEPTDSREARIQKELAKDFEGESAFVNVPKFFVRLALPPIKACEGVLPLGPG